MEQLNPERFKFWDTEVGEHNDQFHHMILNVNKHRFPMESADETINQYVTTTTVLVAGAIGDYACYEGVGSPEWVRDHGNKLTYDQARQCFVGLEERRYRR